MVVQRLSVSQADLIHKQQTPTLHEQPLLEGQRCSKHLSSVNSFRHRDSPVMMVMMVTITVNSS